MKKKFQKSYSLTTEAIRKISASAKKENRTPSDFLDLYVLENLPDCRKKKGYVRK